MLVSFSFERWLTFTLLVVCWSPAIIGRKAQEEAAVEDEQNELPNKYVLKFARDDAQGRWTGPYDVLRDIGADLRSGSEDEGSSTPEELFPIGDLPALKAKRERELLFLGCERSCLFGCRCDGYECKRGDDDHDNVEDSSKEAQRYLTGLLGGRDPNEIESVELQEIEDKALAEWHDDQHDPKRKLLFFQLFGRCTKEASGPSPTSTPTHTPTPQTPKTCDITENQNCGECAPRDFNTLSSTNSQTRYCEFYAQCDTLMAPADCANATANCFVDKCEGINAGRGCYIASTYISINEQCADNQPDRRNRLLGQNDEQEEEDEDEEENNQDALPAPKDKTLLGFVRIPKTGSTTMMNFLDYAQSMYSWDLHLPNPDESLTHSTTTASSIRRKKNRMNLRVAGCIFGYAARKAHLGSGRSKATKKFWNRCPHLPYSVLAERWVKSLSLWSPPPALESSEDASESVIFQENTDLPYTMTLNAFTMVRDPFDRLVSYFYYLRKFTETNEFLKHTATEAQYERVKANDIEGWMELLHTEDGGRGLELPYQYKYVHQDVDIAIELIQQQDNAAVAAPQVLVLLTECYEASLHLLVESFCCFEKDFVHKFVKSEAYMSNSNEASYDDDDNRRASASSLALLREKAEVWFADDYRFYDAAVEQFQRALAQSSTSIGKEELATCPYWTGSK